MYREGHAPDTKPIPSATILPEHLKMDPNTQHSQYVDYPEYRPAPNDGSVDHSGYRHAQSNNYSPSQHTRWEPPRDARSRNVDYPGYRPEPDNGSQYVDYYGYRHARPPFAPPPHAPTPPRGQLIDPQPSAPQVPMVPVEPDPTHAPRNPYPPLDPEAVADWSRPHAIRDMDARRYEDIDPRMESCFALAMPCADHSLEADSSVVRVGTRQASIENGARPQSASSRAVWRHVAISGIWS